MQRVVAACAQQQDGLFGGMAVRSTADLNRLGKAIFAMNCSAVFQRYEEPVEAPKFRYRPLGTISNLAAYRALSCLIYQCSEGDVPTRQLYRDLDALQDRLAHSIASRAADEAKLPWDWPEKSRAAA